MTDTQAESTAMLTALEAANRLIYACWGTHPGRRAKAWQRQSGMIVMPGYGPDGETWGSWAKVMAWDPQVGESMPVRVWAPTWQEAIETVQSLFKGMSPAAAAKHTAKKLSGHENLFLGPGVTTIDPKALEAALWDRMAEKAAKSVPKYKAGKEHYVLGGTLQFYNQVGASSKPTARARLKALVIEKLGRDPFAADDGA